MRDEHLRKDNYFDVKKIFQSTKILPADKAGAFIISGKLTIKNTTKEISFPFTATASQTGYVFKGSFRINRKDFQIGGSSTISDELDLMLNITAVKSCNCLTGRMPRISRVSWQNNRVHTEAIQNILQMPLPIPFLFYKTSSFEDISIKPCGLLLPSLNKLFCAETNSFSFLMESAPSS